METKIFFKFILSLALILHTTIKGAEYDIGANDKEIKIGSVSRSTGRRHNAVGRQKALQAYITMLNENGGINGRKIVYLNRDDQSNPKKTIEEVQNLVGKERVLFFFNSEGSVTANAVQAYLETRKIPNLFVLSAGLNFYDPQKHYWSLGFWPNTYKEGLVIGKFIAKTSPTAKVGILMAKIPIYEKFLNDMKKGMGDLAEQLIVKETWRNPGDPNSNVQFAALKNAGCDLLFTTNFNPEIFNEMEKMDWHPQIYLSWVTYVEEVDATSQLKGITSIGVYKDLYDPKWDNDPSLMAYRKFAEKNLDPESKYTRAFVDGYTRGQILEIILKKCGDNLTRENIMQVATNLSLTSEQLPLLLPGIEYKTTPTDYLGIQQVQMIRFNGKYWEPIDELIQLKNLN